MITKKSALIVAALLLTSLASAAFAARGFWEEGYYLDDQGNVVGYSTIPCQGREILEGVRTSNWVQTGGGSCNLGYEQ